MALSRPLAVAVVAMALLVGSVGFEVVFHRTYALDVRTPDGWATIGASADANEMARPGDTLGGVIVRAAPGENLTFRIRAMNGYPWALEEDYDVRVSGVIVAEGVVTAPSRGEGESSFDVRVAAFLPRTAEPKPVADRNITFAYLDVQVGETYLAGSFQLEEVTR